MTVELDAISFTVLILVPALLGMLFGWYYGRKWERWYWNDVILDGLNARGASKPPVQGTEGANA